eukprot:116510_1
MSPTQDLENGVKNCELNAVDPVHNSNLFRIMLCCLMFMASVSFIAFQRNHDLERTSLSTHSISDRHLLTADGQTYVFNAAGKFKVIEWLHVNGLLTDFSADAGILSDNDRVVLAYALKSLRIPQKTGQDAYITAYDRKDMDGMQIAAFQRAMSEKVYDIRSCIRLFRNDNRLSTSLNTLARQKVHPEAANENLFKSVVNKLNKAHKFPAVITVNDPDWRQVLQQKK